MTSVRLEMITKRFGQTTAVDCVDLEINSGELFFLLGPSGCGKSTLLRLIAGLHEPTEGRIHFNGQDVTRLDTQQRNAVMVFQSYALWPHMSVRENVRFGLDVRGLPRDAQEARVEDVLRLVQMETLAQRKPNQLSGGQQQRVALARALAVKPDCLLLDEPLSNLDAKLRNEMRAEIRRICKKTGSTTIYVTHDQKEALSVADRIAVMDRGRIVQIGTPAELYHRPASRFVAEFIGQTNVISGRVLEQEHGVVRLQTALGQVMALADQALPEEVTIVIRPEQMRIVSGNGSPNADAALGKNRFVGKPIENTFLGESSEHLVDVDGARVRLIASPAMVDVPNRMIIEFEPESVVVLRE